MKSGAELGQASYYAEILILVDGWPWNLSEFDFRSFFAAGSCPPALSPVAAAHDRRAATPPAPVSGNRRARRQKAKRRRARAKKVA
jgi:hypothetical protein